VTRNIVVTLHDAGGTVPPNLAVAQCLVSRGHRVTVLSQPSVAARAEAVGCTFVAFDTLPDYDRTRALEDQLEITVPALAGPAIGDELVAVVEGTRADVVVVDPNLAGSLAAAASLECPSVVLLHSMYATFVDVWFADIWPLLAEPINEARRHFGLGACASWAELLDEHDLLLSPVPPQFDAPISRPPPASLVHPGFLVPAPLEVPGSSRDWFPEGEGPTVLVGLSTTYQHQESLVGSIVEALNGMEVRALVTTGGAVPADDLAPAPHVSIVEYAPHGEILPYTDAVISHGGMGTIAAALTNGVPLVCTPIERDQPLNSRRVAEVGAGVSLDRATVDDISTAAREVLGDRRFRERAGEMAAASARAGEAERAADEILALAERSDQREG
jgi:UDP:flavonoid glycosyltransferase YjiC (YdhE family)